MFGRAGRDGHRALCVCLLSWKHFEKLENTLSGHAAHSGHDSDVRKSLMVVRFLLVSRCCRQAVILKHLGEKAPPDCGNCGNSDICKPALLTDALDITEEASVVLAATRRAEDQSLTIMELVILYARSLT